MIFINEWFKGYLKVNEFLELFNAGKGRVSGILWEINGKMYYFCVLFFV